MKHKFYTYLVKKDGEYITKSGDILIPTGEREYSYDDMSRLLPEMTHQEEFRFGYSIVVPDGDKYIKISLRTNDKKCNETVKGRTLEEWIDFLYDKDEKQLQLF